MKLYVAFGVLFLLGAALAAPAVEEEEEDGFLIPSFRSHHKTVPAPQDEQAEPEATTDDNGL